MPAARALPPLDLLQRYDVELALSALDGPYRCGTLRQSREPHPPMVPDQNSDS
jgi:hypothetical protein